jgi:hypothetical protein
MLLHDAAGVLGVGQRPFCAILALPLACQLLSGPTFPLAQRGEVQLLAVSPAGLCLEVARAQRASFQLHAL